MEKYVAVAAINKEVKVSNQLHIPDDLAFSIMSKLPLKSLKRFGCVRKSWPRLFENPHFMSMYRSNFLSNDHSYYDGTSLLLHQILDVVFSSYYDEQKFALYSLSDERFENKVKLDWPNPFPEDDHGFNILGPGCINGTLCLLCRFQRNIILWNPATKEFKVIPPSPFDSPIIHPGFGYDPVRDDHKVFQYVVFFTHDLDGLPWEDVLEEEIISYHSFWEIYSLRSNSWKKLDVNMPRIATYNNEYVYTERVCHWWSKSETHNEACLVSFDSGNEVFFKTPIPSDTDDNFDYRLVWRQLMLLNGPIAFILNYTETSTFHISILGELGAKETWIKLFIVGPLSFVEYPIGVGKNGDIFFRKKDSELAWFDLSTLMIEELGVIIEKRFSSKILIYKENLLPMGGINN